MHEKNHYYLRPFKRDEVILYKEWIANDKFMGPLVNIVECSLQDLIEDYEKANWQSSDIARWLYCLKGGENDEEVLGFGHAWRFDPYEKHMEFGRLLLPAYRGQGLGSHLLKILISKIFDQFPDTDRLQAITACTNIPVLHTWKNQGVQREGTLRSFMTLNDEYVDCFLGSILRKEWETSRT